MLSDVLSKHGLTDPQIRILEEVFQEEYTIDRNAFFHSEGDVCKRLAFVTEGMFRYFYITEDGEEITRWITLENDFMTSLSSFITQMPSNEYIQAIKPSRIRLLSRERWMELYKQHEFIRNFWIKTIEYNYIGMEVRVYNLISMTASQRYDWMRKKQPRFITEVPDKYVASMLGIKPRHLTRLRAQK